MERFNSFSSDQIILTKRQVSMILASMVLFCLFIFIVGFFLGKRLVIDDYSSQVTKQTLHDQIDFLLTTQSLQTSQDESNLTLEAETPDVAVISDDMSLQEINIPAIITDDRLSENISNAPVIITSEIISKQEFQSPAFHASNSMQQGKQYAQLIGFGTKKAALAFVARLKKHDVPVILKTVISKTSSGKQRTWYQAITPTYESSEELQSQVSKIKRLEHIRDKDIKIVYTK